MDEANIGVIDTLALVARLILGGFLLPSALGKLRDRSGFVQGTIDYQILPEPIARRFALVLPWVELVLALALLAGVALPLTGAATALLLLSFIVAVTINLQRGRAIACHCHGITGTKTISWGTIARNVLLLLLTLPLIDGALDLSRLAPRWRTDLMLLITPAPLLLLAFGCVTIPLVEWAVDIQLRMAQLRGRMRQHERSA